MTTSLTTTIDNTDLSITTPSTIQVHTAYNMQRTSKIQKFKFKLKLFYSAF